MIALPDIILASGSPRRAEILSSAGWKYTKEVPDVDESPIPGETPEIYVVRLACEKAGAIASRHSASPVLGADTVVVIGGEMIGKPTDLDHAREMLKMLSGNWHDVLTGVAICVNGTVVSGLRRTRVKFAWMNDAEIEFLALQGDPLDKAGAYAVQAQAALFIEAIEGDYWNVVGLPINLVYELLRSVVPTVGNRSGTAGGE